MVREQFYRFAQDKVAPFAHQWHLKDELIPLDVISEMSALGVFGLTIPEEFGGAGLSKTAMCVVSEELSRGYIGVGSLGTRSEIAAELIITGGTKDQREHWLPLIASGAKLPTAVFTEPNTGSDLGSLRTRAEKHGDHYKIHRQQDLDHACGARRSDDAPGADRSGHERLSRAFHVPGREAARHGGDPFPAKGMTGGEIKVLGYRGMKEYEIGFDGFEVPASNLLGGFHLETVKTDLVFLHAAIAKHADFAAGHAVCRERFLSVPRGFSARNMESPR